jgi:hypothetical protein
MPAINAIKNTPMMIMFRFKETPAAPGVLVNSHAFAIRLTSMTGCTYQNIPNKSAILFTSCPRPLAT